MSERSPAVRTPPDVTLARFDVVVKGIGRVTIHGSSVSTTLGELGSAAGLPRRDSFVVDGVSVPATTPLVKTDIRHASTVELGGRDAARHRGGAALLRATWIIGPDAGGAVNVTAGRTFIGRAASAVVSCADPALEPHHAVIEADGDQAVVTQLSGARPIELDGVAIYGSTPIRAGQRLDFGASVLLLEPPPPDTESPSDCRPGSGLDPWRRAWRRTPRSCSHIDVEPIEAPRHEGLLSAAGGGLIPTLVGLAGAAVLAALFGQVMFLVFGVVGSLVALAAWAAQRVGLLRSRRSARRLRRVDGAVFEQALVQQRLRARDTLVRSVRTLPWAIAAITRTTSDLWSVRGDDRDAYTVSIGRGDVEWSPVVAGVDRNTPAEIVTAIAIASWLDDVPVAVCLGGGTVLALTGPHAAAVARSLVLQLAAASGPCDWRLAIVTGAAEQWRCLGWLPHAESDREGVLIADADRGGEVWDQLQAGDDRHLVLIGDAEMLASRTSSVRRLLASERSVAVISIGAAEIDVPMIATSWLATSRDGRCRWVANTRTDALPLPVRLTGVSAARANEVSASIASLVDPERCDGQADLPARVDLLELLAGNVGRDPAALVHRVAAGWLAHSSGHEVQAPIGRAADGVVELDIVNDGPHVLIAGTTGAGKSELLRTLVVGLATKLSPERITFVLIDYKGGSTFDACAELPHVVGVVTDLDGRLGDRALRSLDAELRRRERLLREAGVTDVTDYLADGGREPLPRLVVMIDEFATLAAQQPDFIAALLSIAQRGRSLGVHLVLATQRPHGVVSDDVRANTNARIALRVQDATDSVDVIGDPAAARLSRAYPGRAIVRLGSDAPLVFQTASCTGDDNVLHAAARLRVERHLGGNDRPDRDGRDASRTDVIDGSSAPTVACRDSGRSALRLLVDAACRAARMNGIAAPHRAWLPELSAAMDAIVVDGVRTVGVIDDPDHQRRLPLRWPRNAHLLVTGAVGAGTTTALLALAAELGSISAPISLFVIDAIGDARLRSLQSLPSCGGVVAAHERERIIRLLALLAGELESRRSSPDRERDGGSVWADLVVMIDGLTALRTSFEHDDMFDDLERLDRLVADGPGVGLLIVATTAQPARLPSVLLSQFGERWVFHLTDSQDASILGVAPASIPGPVPGRLVVSSSGLEAQVISPNDATLLACASRPVLASPLADAARSRLRPLPTVIDADHLPPARCVDRLTEVPVGLSFRTLDPVWLPVGDIDHVMVIGPARSGRTTALLAVAAMWRGAHPDTVVASIAPRHSSARAGQTFRTVDELMKNLPMDRPCLVVADDAELVDDPSSELARVLTSRAGHVTVIAAGRPESLRGAYGHWTGAVRRSRLGFVMASGGDLDGDLLGAVLPRRLPIAARPGLAWQIAEGSHQLVQLASTTTCRECP